MLVGESVGERSSMFSQKQTTHDPQFVENREKIKRHFESLQLRGLVKEFYTVQKQFHHNMGQMVTGFSQLTKELPTVERYQLTALLQPYRALTENPFGEYTGDIEDDIHRILQVVNRQNQQFKHILSTIMTIIAHLNTFSEFIKSNQEDPQFTQRMIKLLQCNTTLQVENLIYHPFQHVMRYELLLKELTKELNKEKAFAEEKIAQALCESLQFLTKEIENININKESMYMLYRIERTLEKMLDAVVTVTSSDNANAAKMREQIEFVIVSVKAGMKNIMQAKNDGSGLYEGLRILLKDTEKLYIEYLAEPKAHIVSRMTGYAVSTTTYVLTLPISIPLTMFGLYNTPTQKSTALEELQAHIKSIEETLLQVESLLCIAQQRKASVS